MAAASPILVNSSSPNITSPGTQNKSRSLISSSPGLVSPSSFIKPRPSMLKTGSRAQQAPDVVNIGPKTKKTKTTAKRKSIANDKSLLSAGTKSVVSLAEHALESNTASDSVEQRPTTTDSETLETPGQLKQQLTDILRDFSYVSKDSESLATTRTVTGEAVTKRRRIELAAPVGLSTVSPVGLSTVSPGEEQLKPSKPPKQKKERKKPQTITALATAAFQPPKEGSVSNFFSPQKERTDDQTVPTEQPKPKATKPRKPRKPREQATGAATTGTTTKPKKLSKAKAPKVKPNEANCRPKLYSPDRATAQLKNQTFLFGTSSQLAVNEPASLIRDVQIAIQQSELQPATRTDGATSSQALYSQAQQSPQGNKSCIRVPTAPHGTCLSIEQAERALWSVSSRDGEGGVLRKEEMLDDDLNIAAEVGAEIHLPNTDSLVVGTEAAKAEQQLAEMATMSAVVDLCGTSPITVSLDAPISFGNADHVVAPNEEEDRGRDVDHTDLVEEPVDVDDDWMLLKTSSPALVGTEIPAAVRPKSLLGDLKTLSPRRFRPPLSPLNPNIMMLTELSPGRPITSGQPRAFSTTSPDRARKSASPSGRPRGRPRKDAVVESFSPSLPKRRGRPPKLKALASDPSPQSPQTKKRKPTSSTSRPTKQVDWLDIDEIYDSDSPSTPSPPRRRAKSSPPAVQPLTLSPSGSPSLKAKAPAVVAVTTASTTSTLKPKDTNWASIRSELFIRITAVIKIAPRSNDASKPSWWEKILLYDPIVLEDLTAWLNDQGLRVEVKKTKPKAKRKGRKKKDDEVEWEVHEELLQAWMVQKWCEEKSICCLWKEGLRGGVRTRY